MQETQACKVLGKQGVCAVYIMLSSHVISYSILFSRHFKTNEKVLIEIIGAVVS